jgi:SAM-dependent methyltransferase
VIKVGTSNAARRPRRDTSAANGLGAKRGRSLPPRSMMVYVYGKARDIVSMPRGGPDASWLDRRLQTDRLEYLDRDGVDDLKQKVVRSLDRAGRRRFLGAHKKLATIVLDEVADVPSPKILELGAGLGGLSSKLLETHPTAQVTVTDIDPTFVAAVAAGDLGSHPRATVQQMDATAIDAPDGHYDLAVFAMSLHHLPPALAAQVFAEGTRAANKLLVIDLRRPPAPLHVVVLAPVWPLTGLIPVAHDGFISQLRAYSPSALTALAQFADPAITVEFRAQGLGPTVAVASRARQAEHSP